MQNGSKQTLLEAIDAYDFNGDGQECAWTARDGLQESFQADLAHSV